MSKKDVVKEYSNGELTVVWKPAKCFHAKVCINMLPEVYDPKAKPWIKPNNASTEALKAQIDKCPSGALSYYTNDASEDKVDASPETKVEMLKNGPLLVYGTLNISDLDGNIETKEDKTAFCRCGHSNNKPYCDGSHAKSNFEG